LVWAISHAPDDGTSLGGSLFARTLQGAVSIGLPTVTALYVIEKTAIVIASVQFADAKGKGPKL
jgi:hypothetical protein